jgi:ATP-dependent Clp protease protease subunit
MKKLYAARRQTPNVTRCRPKINHQSDTAQTVDLTAIEAAFEEQGPPVEIIAEAPAPSAHHAIYLVGPVEEDMVMYVMQETFDVDRDVESVTVLIHSPGGQLDAGMAIIDLLQSIRRPIKTIAYGLVGSAALDIFLCGDERCMGPNASLFVHDVRQILAENTQLTPQRSAGLSASLARSARIARRRIAKATGQSMETVTKWCEEEREFSARQAVKLGFAHRLIRTGRRR